MNKHVLLYSTCRSDKKVNKAECIEWHSNDLILIMLKVKLKKIKAFKMSNKKKATKISGQQLFLIA